MLFFNSGPLNYSQYVPLLVSFTALGSKSEPAFFGLNDRVRIFNILRADYMDALRL